MNFLVELKSKVHGSKKCETNFNEKNHYCPQIYEFLKQLFSIKSIKMSDAYKGGNEFEMSSSGSQTLSNTTLLEDYITLILSRSLLIYTCTCIYQVISVPIHVK